MTKSRQRIAKDQSTARPGQGDIKQASLFFEVGPAIPSHGRWKQIFFHPNHKNFLKFQAFGLMNGHQTNIITVLGIVVLVHGGQQRDMLQKGPQTAIVPRNHLVRFTKFFDRIE